MVMTWWNQSAMHVGKGKVFIALGGNFLSATQIQITQPKHYGVAVLPFTSPPK